MLETILGLFQGSVALLTFFSIFAAGMLFTLTSLLFGGDADHGDGDFDHHGDHAGDAHDHGPGMLSIRGVSLFAVGFGGVAFIVHIFTEKVLVSSVSGLMFGWVFAFLLLAMLRVFLRQQSSSLIQPTQVVGASGLVTTSIGKQQPGEVTLSIAGTQMTKMATAADGTAIAHGTPVRVVRYLGGTVAVEPLGPRPGDTTDTHD